MKQTRRLKSANFAQKVTLPSSCRSLIWVDSTPIRMQEVKNCQKIFKKLESSRRAIKRYEEEDVQAFQMWFFSFFGERITELRELDAKVRELRHIVDDVELRINLSGCSEYEAYQSYIQFKNKSKELRKQHNSSNSFEENIENQEQFSSGQKDDFSEEMTRAFFESLFGKKENWSGKSRNFEKEFAEFKKEFDFNHRQSSFGSDHTNEEGNSRSEGFYQNNDHSYNPEDLKEAKIDQSKNTRLKERYRELARKLHPDLNPNLSPKYLEIWHQVQAAYEAEDLERIHTLSAMVVMHDENLEKIDSISLLRNLFQELKDSLKMIERKLRQAKKDPAWNFREKLTEPKKLAKIQYQMSQDLKDDLYDLKNEQSLLESLIQSWTSPPKRRTSSKRYKRRNPYFEELW